MDFLFVQFHSTIKLDLFQFMELNLQHVLSYNPIVTMYGIVLHKKEL